MSILEIKNLLSQSKRSVVNKKWLEDELLAIERLNLSQKFLDAVESGSKFKVENSTVAFLLEISDMVPNGPPKSLYVDVGRNDYPDIDLDFEDKKRGQVKEYLKKKWGAENVAGISTFTTFRPKGIVKDVSRVMGVDYSYVNGLTPLFDTLDELERNPKASKLIDEHPEVIRIARKVEGRVKGAGAHAAGMVVASRPLHELVPIETRKEEGNDERIEVVAYDMNEVADLGLIKFDALGLKALAIIEDCSNIIKERYGIDIEADLLNLDDNSVFPEFNSGNTVGIFQVEAAAYSLLLKEMDISNFSDLAVSNALVRPGALVTQGKSYLAAKSGKKAVAPIHPLIDDILAETKGTVIYQEQLMQVAVSLADFSWSEADKLRKIIGKKRDAAEFEPFKDKFVTNAGAHIGAKKAEKMWTDFEKASEYMFNKSHAVGYSILSYQTAWLKHHYPTEFIWSSLVNEDDQSRIATLLLEAHKMGVHINGPDINTSDVQFTLLGDGAIQFGLRNVAGCGPTAIAEIIKKRPFASFEEFTAKCLKSKVRSNVVQNLEKVDGFRSLNHHADYDYIKYYLPVLNYPFYAENDETFKDVIEKIADIDSERPEFHVVRGMVKSTKRKPHYFRVEIEDSSGSTAVFADDSVQLKAKDYICALIGDKSLVGFCDGTQLDDPENEFVQFLKIWDTGEMPSEIAEGISYLNPGANLGIVLTSRTFQTKAKKTMATSYILDLPSREIKKVVLFSNSFPRLSPYLNPGQKIVFKIQQLDNGICFEDIIGLPLFLNMKRD